MAARNDKSKKLQLPVLASKATELSTDVIIFDQQLAAEVRSELKQNLRFTRNEYISASVFQTMATFMFGGGVAISVLSGDVALALCGALPTLLIGALAKASTQTADYRGTLAAQEAQSKLIDAFNKAQSASFGKNQQQLVELAETHLSAGNLLDENSLAYLAAVDPEHLKNASQQLAISVYQTRKMLAHQADAQIERPLTFANLDLTAKSEKHRFILAEKLRNADTRIAEDSGPELQNLLPVEAKFKDGGLKGIVKTIFTPYFAVKELQRFRNVSLPDLPDVRTPALRPVDNFAVKLHKYETEIERLDLPALRGWPKAVKALPRPSA